jgi:phenylacetate-CoA ligase
VAAFRTKIKFAIPASTGGTSGTPIRLWRSLECVAAERAFLDHMLEHPNLSFRRSRIAVLRGDNVKDPADEAPPYGVYVHRGRRLVLSTPHLSRRTVAWFVQALHEFHPDMFWVYPGPLANFLKLMLEVGLSLKIPFVVASSEVMPPATAEAARKVLSSVTIDYYGLAERSCFAFSFKPMEYWFSPAYGKVELIPEQEEPALQSITRLRIVGTGYWNTAMPLMRYDTGDYAIVPAGTAVADLERIAMGLKPFLGIEGRSNEFIVAPDGKRISALDHIARDVENILRLQLVQNEKTSLTVKVLAKPGFGQSDRQKILRNARLKLPPDINVSVAVVDRLDTSPNGKTPYLIKHNSL